MTTPRIRFLVLVAAVMTSCQAAGAGQFETCISLANGVSSEMLACGKAEADRWDARLNTAYRTLMRHSSAPAASRLRAEQRAWLTQHQRETRRLADDPANGSVAFLQSQSFELEDLQERTLELERRLPKSY